MSVAGDDPMLGVQATSDATLVVPATATGAGGIRVERVVAPEGGWLLARSASAPGGVLGSVRVPRGVSRDVRVPLTADDGTPVRLTLHVDRGAQGVLEFEAGRPEACLDRPVFSGDSQVQRVVSLSDYGTAVLPNAALIRAADGRAGTSELVVSYLLLPRAGWIVVRPVRQGVPRETVAVLGWPAGEWHEVRVPLASALVAGTYAVTVYADDGARGVFDEVHGDPLASADRPLVSAGVPVSQRVTVR